MAWRRWSCVLPSGLVEASRLDAPIFTPPSKAALGEHDLPMTRDEVAAQLGAEMTGRVEALTTQILARANDLVADRGSSRHHLHPR